MICEYCKTEHNRKSSFCSAVCKNKSWYRSNIEHKKQYRINNIDKIKAKEEKYRLSGKAKERNKRWYDKSGPQYYSHRKKVDLNFRLRCRIRDRIYFALNGKSKPQSVTKAMGCSVENLIKHLESKWQPGMTWDNWTTDGWHIDHIKPLSSFDLSNIQQFADACHYSNLQPMWAKDNLKKSDKDK